MRSTGGPEDDATSWAWRWTRAFVALGLGLRLVRYAVDNPLWGDEAFVAVNLIARGYRDLLRPLDYGQICPVLFLWGVRASVGLFGFGEWSLRLVPMACGLAGVVLFLGVARGVARGLALLLAVAIFAVSAPPIRYAAEVKPYASDLLAALLLIGPASAWLREPGRAGRLWALAGIAPIAMAMSHPAAFVAAGIGLALAAPVLRAGRSAVVPFLAFGLAAAASFLALYVLVLRPQDAAMPADLRGYWDGAFPPLGRPLALARWLIAAHTGKMLAYPGGGDGGASSLTLGLVVAGSVALWRRGDRATLGVLLGPLALTLVASAFRRYPYGGEARHMQYLAPSFCLLAGIGGEALIRAVPRSRARLLLARAAAWALAASGPVLTFQYINHPYVHPYDREARAFARRFWPELARDAEVACATWDFGLRERGWWNPRSAFYLCNQMIYCPSRRRGAGPRWDAVTATRPLRCVLYDGMPPDHPDVAAWLAAMRRRYDLRGARTVVAAMAGPGSRAGGERLVVFEFVPRAGAGPAVAGGQPVRR